MFAVCLHGGSRCDSGSLVSVRDLFAPTVKAADVTPEALSSSKTLAPQSESSRRDSGSLLFVRDSCSQILTVSTVSGSCESQIWRFTVARRAFITCFRRVMTIFAGISQGNLEIALRYECAPRYCKTLKTILFCVSRCGAVRIYHEN